MASDQISATFPSEYEEVVLNILETYGPLKSVSAMADYLGVSPTALKAFLQTNRAKEASAKAHSGIKGLVRKHIRLSPSAYSYPSLSEFQSNGMSIYDMDVPEGLVSAYLAHKERKKNKTKKRK